MNEDINRRDFLKKSVKSVAVAALAFNAIDLTKVLASVPEKFSASRGNSQKVINLSEYPSLNSVGGYAVISKNLIVIRTSQTGFLALSQLCTHKKCTVEFDGTEFECPCHGSKFDKTGKVKTGPAKKNLKRYNSTYNSGDNTLTIDI